MKEVIAIIRSNKITATKEALDNIGFPGMTAAAVLGRGKQKGIAGEVSFSINPELLEKGKNAGMKYVPKRMISLVVNDDDVEEVVKTIIKVNQTGQTGDGKIFVCPIENVVRVRTRESGKKAIM
ncbi:P-II family nitrogen regulator [Thermoanaerobacterium sp. RBIITD]|uniref:P-II family nitrogen regulator n=1 Tax=Thermoanaerobacterium sp. RBIITD TaxID=1550240 RepID=UPI000BB9437E|nr:P-II family nitrogen regulator [Thermoanaerobacterium sp. RBIITD]SNX54941.1 nitrogen regulatory protein P-II family [Thermoanaerobacterium sp. RBIITD]